MIKTEQVTKRFDEIVAVDRVTAEIREGDVFGLIGTNGAGKSTFLRMLSGILKPDEGTVTIDGQGVWEAPEVKARFFYISDEQYFFSNSTPQEMMQFYRRLYPAFDEKRFFHLLESFGLKKDRKKQTGSIYTLTVRGQEHEVRSYMESMEPMFYELIPLSLEEIFISETEVAGYDIKTLVL